MKLIVTGQITSQRSVSGKPDRIYSRISYTVVQDWLDHIQQGYGHSYVYIFLCESMCVYKYIYIYIYTYL